MEHKYSDLLKKNSIMPTKQRLEIADIIFKKHQHFTANEIIERIKTSNLPTNTIQNIYIIDRWSRNTAFKIVKRKLN